MRSSFIPTLFALLTGCSLLNAPDRDRIVADAGPDDDVIVVDGGPDGFVPDANFDAGHDAGSELCDMPGDEDGNGLSDCSDFACLGYEGCCSGGTREPIRFVPRSEAWISSGRVDVRTDEDDVVFGEDVGTHVRRSCFPVAQGAVFEVEIEQDLGVETECVVAMNERCDDYASFFLSSVNVAAPGALIVAELGVRVYASGRAELYRERDDEVDVIDVLDLGPPLDRNIEIVFRVAPDVVGGEGVLRGTVSVDNTFFSETPTIRQRDLLPECGTGITGLYYGIEGRGRRLSVENQRAVESTLACTNPTQFRDTLRRPLVASNADSGRTSLDWQRDEWPVADVTHPELVRVEVGGDVFWHVFGSTAPRQLDFSTLPDFPWHTAHSFTETWNTNPWSAPEMPFQREGALQPTVTNDATGLVYVAVMEDELRYCDSPSGACRTLVTPEETCAELANPSIVATPDGNYLLLYQCTDRTNETELRALTLNSRVMGNTSFVVLDTAEFGGLASVAIVDFDVLLDSRNEDEYLVRVWLVGEALGNVRTLLLATGTIKLNAESTELESLEDGFRLVPYTANPVATEEGLFRDTDQTLQGVSVERDGSPHDLLFLLGRRTERTEGRLYDFVPVEQTWGNL